MRLLFLRAANATVGASMPSRASRDQIPGSLRQTQPIWVNCRLLKAEILSLDRGISCFEVIKFDIYLLPHCLKFSHFYLVSCVVESFKNEGLIDKLWKKISLCFFQKENQTNYVFEFKLHENFGVRIFFFSNFRRPIKISKQTFNF